MPMTRSSPLVPRRTLVRSLILSVVLFVVAAPLGDKTHGIGKHHPVVAIIGDVVFAWSLISIVTFVALVAVFLVQNGPRSQRHA